MRQTVGRFDIVKVDFDVLDLFAVMHRRLYWPLVLVKKRDAADQGEILQVIPACAGLAIQET